MVYFNSEFNEIYYVNMSNYSSFKLDYKINKKIYDYRF